MAFARVNTLTKGAEMKCPVCKGKEHVKIDLHSDGYSQSVRECGDCGSVWTFSGNLLKIIKGRDEKVENDFAHFMCPTCKSTASIETDLDAFQFHEEIYECTTCGTICSSAHNHIEVVMDSQKGSFLSPTSDQVEADDYVFV